MLRSSVKHQASQKQVNTTSGAHLNGLKTLMHLIGGLGKTVDPLERLFATSVISATLFSTWLLSLTEAP
jgi:hypothetical protein